MTFAPNKQGDLTGSVNILLATENCHPYLEHLQEVKLLEKNALFSQPDFWTLRNWKWKLWMRLVFKHLLLERAPSLGNPFASRLDRVSLKKALNNRRLRDIAGSSETAFNFISDLYITDEMRIVHQRWLTDACDTHIFAAEAMLTSSSYSKFIFLASPPPSNCTPLEQSFHDYSIQVQAHLKRKFPERVLILQELQNDITTHIADFLDIPPQGTKIELSDKQLTRTTAPLKVDTEKSLLNYLERRKSFKTGPSPRAFLTALSTFVQTAIERLKILFGIQNRNPEPKNKLTPKQIDPTADPQQVWNTISSSLSQNFPTPTNEDCDTIIAIAFTDRYEILGTICKLLISYKSTINLRIVLVGSNQKDREFGMRLESQFSDIRFFQFENYPLGAKWQFAVECARKFNPKSLVILGSDDLVGPAFFSYLKIILTPPQDTKSNKVGMYGFQNWYMWDCRPDSKFSGVLWNVSYCSRNTNHILGAGRIYPRAFLDKIGWNLFEINWKCWLDNLGEEQVQDIGWTCKNIDQVPLLSVKGNWSAMNSTDGLLTGGYISAIPHDFLGEQFLAREFPALIEELKREEATKTQLA